MGEELDLLLACLANRGKRSPAPNVTAYWR
jgi:hypothetical protein